MGGGGGRIEGGSCRYWEAEIECKVACVARDRYAAGVQHQ